MSGHLSDEIKLKNGTRIKNRLFKSAMSEQLGDKAHNPTKKLVNLYKSWAEGGIGLSVTGNVMIDRTALGEPRNVVLDEQSDLTMFKEWANAGKRNNTHIWMQLNHPGKQSPNFLSKEPLAPSAIRLGGELASAFNPPRELTEIEIKGIIERFAASAMLAKKAGFTGVQMHSAHGYLINQFLSPHHNRREDQWGGSLENRMRFAVEVYRAIREAVGSDFPVGIKLNSSDFKNGGFTIDDAIQVAVKLEQDGIDLIEISGGTYENPSMMGNLDGDTKEGYFLDYAEKMRKSLSIPLVLTGGFRSASAMQKAIGSGATDMIGLARPLALEPSFPDSILKNENHAIVLPRLSTGVRTIDKLTMLPLTWYEYQLYNIGKGKKTRLKGGEWRSVFLTFWRTGSHAFRTRRAK